MLNLTKDELEALQEACSLVANGDMWSSKMLGTLLSALNKVTSANMPIIADAERARQEAREGRGSTIDEILKTL